MGNLMKKHRKHWRCRNYDDKRKICGDKLEKYQKCYCPECKKEECPHRGAIRRVPVIDGGLGLCPNLKGE